MKYRSLYFISAILIIVSANVNANAQSFAKGSLLFSLSEGTTHSTYVTGNLGNESDGFHAHIAGERDPLVLEYGITNKIGIGLTMGGDIYSLKDNDAYNFISSTGTLKSVTSEMTFDINYHFFNNKHFDISAFVATGSTSVTIKDMKVATPAGDYVALESLRPASDYTQKYFAAGQIMRTGIKVRYYPLKHFGLVYMLSAFSANNTPSDQAVNSSVSTYYTSIKGITSEFGLCFRFLK